MALIIKKIIQEIFPSLPEMTAVVEHQEETVCLRVDGFNNKLDEHSSRVYFNSININGMLKVQKSPRWQHVYITFESIDQCNTAKQILQGRQYQDSTLSCSYAKAFVEKVSKKRKRAEQQQQQEDLCTEAERLNDKVTPLWRQPYEKQLESKQISMQTILNAYQSSLQKLLPDDHESPQFSQRLLPIIESPEQARHGYRNKCEFSTGLDSTGQPAVGFMLGLFKEGMHAVASCMECVHVDDNSKAIVRLLEDYIRANKLPVFNRITHEGYWRLAMVRSQLSGEGTAIVNLLFNATVNATNNLVMILIQIHPQQLSADEIESEQLALANFFQHKIQQSFAIPSITQLTILWQSSDAVHNGLSDKHPVKVLVGTGIIHEDLRGVVNGQLLVADQPFRFRISANSFFQSSTLACELLYGRIGDWVVAESLSSKPLPRQKIVLDLCCGTGTIGIILSRRPDVRFIFGIEMCASAVEDAKHNAKLNGIHLDPELEPLPLPLDDNDTQATAPRFQFICAKVEEALSRLLVYLQQSQIDLSQYEVVAILDPPRAGTHKSVSKAIRECPFIQRVIYVSCSPKSAMQNWLELTRPENSEKRFRGRPFELQRALPFDMFPQTELCELLLEFTR